MNEHKNERDPFNQSSERVLRRFLPAALAEMGGDDAGGEKPPPGPAMPRGAPLRWRTAEYERLVETYAGRLRTAVAFADAHPGARGDKALADARRVTVAMAPSSRNARRLDGRGDQGTRGLRFTEAKTYLDVQRYAMNEAIARVFGADAVQEQRGRFRIYAPDGSRAGRGDRRTFTQMPTFIGDVKRIDMVKEEG